MYTIKPGAEIYKIDSITSSINGTVVTCGDKDITFPHEAASHPFCAVGHYVAQMAESSTTFLDSTVVEGMFVKDLGDVEGELIDINNMLLRMREIADVIPQKFDRVEQSLSAFENNVVEELTPDIAFAFLVSHAFRTVNYNILCTEEEMEMRLHYDSEDGNIHWIISPHNAPTYGGEFPVKECVGIGECASFQDIDKAELPESFPHAPPPMHTDTFGPVPHDSGAAVETITSVTKAREGHPLHCTCSGCEMVQVVSDVSETPASLDVTFDEIPACQANPIANLTPIDLDNEGSDGLSMGVSSKEGFYNVDPVGKTLNLEPVEALMTFWYPKNNHCDLCGGAAGKKFSPTRAWAHSKCIKAHKQLHGGWPDGYERPTTGGKYQYCNDSASPRNTDYSAARSPEKDTVQRGTDFSSSHTGQR